MKFLDELNENQRQAVEYVDGASLIIAGAGSGKTRVLTYKIAYLLKKGFAPSSILALTFTNKAAREMKSRIAELVGEGIAKYLWMGTFHAIFSRILRAEAEKIGYTSNFSIYDTSDSNSLIKSIIKSLNLDDKTYKPNMVQSRISSAKNNLITHNAYGSHAELVESDQYAKVPRMHEIYQIYTEKCKQADAMDFDDLLLQTNILFRDHPDVLQKYQAYFKYILVDEYQDTNYAQYLIIRKLSQGHQRICVVGDDSQSIYSFRGANIDNILQFRNNYANAQIFKLERNYRSTKAIVSAANSLIDKNKNRIPKTVYTEKDEGERIKVLELNSDFEEGAMVAKFMKEFKKDDEFSYKDMAILYRTNAQSRVLEDQLRKNAIPYRIYGGLSFYQRKEIKDVIAYCRLICNPSDEEALKRVINTPARGIGNTTVNKLLETAALHGVTAWEVMGDMLKYNLPVHSGTANKLKSFREMIAVFMEQKDTIDAYHLVDAVIKTTGLITETYSDHSPESISRRENIDELLNALKDFYEERTESGESAMLVDFLAEVSLLTDQDTDNEAEDEKITMMTVHAAKGLEFKLVFVVGMEESLFPSAFAVESARELEEERRLFYVAITRAEERCFISYATSRFRNGQMNFSNPSRFIKDIDTQYLEFPIKKSPAERDNYYDDDMDDFSDFGSRRATRSYYPKSSDRNTSSRYTNDSSKSVSRLRSLGRSQSQSQSQSSDNVDQPIDFTPTIPVGKFVKHAKFGLGKVVSVSMSAGSEKVEVDFGSAGTKTLLLKFAKLEVLD